MENRTTGTLLVLLALFSLPVSAVEMMDDADMGGIHIQSGNVLNIVGPTAAGGDAPPIEQTAGTQSSLAMALSLRESNTNRPEDDDFTRDRNVLALIFPALDVDTQFEREVASPAGSGSTSVLILPNQNQVNTSTEMIQGRPALRVEIDTRIEQLEWDNVRFPEQVVFDNGNTTIMRGFQFQARGLLREAVGN